MVGQAEMTWYESDNPNGFRTGRRFSLDEPFLTVMAGGAGGDSLGHWHLVSDGTPAAAGRSDGGKPPYRVPSMDEIMAVPWNGRTVASTFSGAGGSCLGYRMAGFRVAWANEFEPNAAECHHGNFPDCVMDTRDVRTVRPEEVIGAVGLREKSWGRRMAHGDGTVQRSDDLFFEYARLLAGLRPKVFVAENVSGLVKGVAKGYFKRILQALKECGYVVEARLLDAQWLGVPQARQRVIFVGVRADLAGRYGARPAFPVPFPFRYSVREAIPWPGNLAAVEGANGFDGHAPAGIDVPARTVQAGRPVRAIHDTSGRFSLGDVTERPSPSVTASGSGQLWMERASREGRLERRRFTIAELRRICSFPDDFILVGTYAQRWARLGNSVPPLMARAVAVAIRDRILAHVP